MASTLLTLGETTVFEWTWSAPSASDGDELRLRINTARPVGRLTAANNSLDLGRGFVFADTSKREAAPSVEGAALVSPRLPLGSYGQALLADGDAG